MYACIYCQTKRSWKNHLQRPITERSSLQTLVEHCVCVCISLCLDVTSSELFSYIRGLCIFPLCLCFSVLRLLLLSVTKVLRNPGVTLISDCVYKITCRVAVVKDSYFFIYLGFPMRLYVRISTSTTGTKAVQLVFQFGVTEGLLYNCFPKFLSIVSL